MSLGKQLKSFLSSSQGKKLVERGKRELSKPENQQKVKGLLGRLNKR